MKQIKCPNCEYQGSPKIETPGSFLIEVVLWLCFVVPGLVYSLWRLDKRHPVCPRCRFVNVYETNGKEVKKYV